MGDEVLDTAIDATAQSALAKRGLRFALLTSSDETFEPWFQAVERGFHAGRAAAETMPNRIEGFALTEIPSAAAWSRLKKGHAADTSGNSPILPTHVRTSR